MEARIIVAILREVLTVRDVALELRCSVAHVNKRYQWESKVRVQTAGYSNGKKKAGHA